MDISPKYLYQNNMTKLSDYEETLIMAQGYRGGYSAVTEFIRAWRSDSGKAVKAFVPLVFENGKAFQFDCGKECMMVGGVFHKVQAEHLKLCASRAFC